jgi:hypothetical protein
MYLYYQLKSGNLGRRIGTWFLGDVVVVDRRRVRGDLGAAAGYVFAVRHRLEQLGDGNGDLEPGVNVMITIFSEKMRFS